ncbi:adenylate cyclase type 2-like isoform X2 [Tachypleus tridentatus]|uniref:adenylate cyclase type 2-like isoform X2 n=1 Tax=Tachypleus tridentatus TaxID=6853 RepID=UPI003FD06FEE
MAGLEILARESLPSLRSSSQASLMIAQGLGDGDETSWSWHYLKEKFRLSETEKLFYKYHARVQHSIFMSFLLFNIFYYCCSIIGYFLLTQKDIVFPVSLRFAALMAHLVTYILAYKEMWFKEELVRTAVAGIFVFVMLVSEHVKSLHDLVTTETERNHRIRPTYYILLATYVMLPFPHKYQNVLAGIIVTVFELLITALTHQKSQSERELLFKMMIADTIYYCIVGFIGFYIRFLLELMNRRSFLDRREVTESRYLLENVKKQEEMLLYSILPKDIASEITESVLQVLYEMDKRPNLEKKYVSQTFNQLHVKQHRNVTILYADIVNSMLLTANLKVNELVMTLNELFGRFDEKAEKNKCTRVKLLGDCYYCVAGVIETDVDHAKNSVEMGLDMIDIIRTVREEQGIDVDMRIGVHTGNVLSGLIGLRKWQFDIWSRDVTIASHMEQSGKPGRVHITLETLKQLENEYDVYPGFGHQRDEYLAQQHVETFFVLSPRSQKPQTNGKRDSIFESTGDIPKLTGRRQSMTPAPVLARANQRRNVRRSSTGGDGDGFTFRSRRTTILDYSITNFQMMRKSVNKGLDSAINRMQLSKKDQWCNNNGIHPLFLTFYKLEQEKPYLTQIDPLFKYYLLCVFFLFLGMLMIHILMMSRTLYFWLSYSVTLVIILVCCLATWIGYLWIKIKSSEEDNLLYRTAFVSRLVKRVNESLPIRVLLFIMICVLMLACAMLGLGECVYLDKKDKGNSSSYLYEQTTISGHSGSSRVLTDELGCKYPWYYTYCAVLAMTATSTFLRLHFLLKFVINVTALAVFFFLITMEESDVFSTGEFLFSDWVCQGPTEMKHCVIASHCAYLIVIFIALHILDRQVEYLCRLDFLMKRYLASERERVKDIKTVNRFLLINILPTHVADLYLNNGKPEGLYHEEYSSVAVMFASIPNYMDFYSENVMNEDGLRCLMVLNEIICDFDTLLYHPNNARIEKIKTIGSTYMAAVGLQPGRGSTETTGEENPVQNVLTLVRFASSMMEVLHFINKDTLQEFSLRVGIAVGPVIAGVVGAGKPQYDIWGDTVNVASRMDSTGVHGRIQVTKEVADIIMEDGTHELDCRGEIHVKGKGKLVTYLVKTPFDEPDTEITEL